MYHIPLIRLGSIKKYKVVQMPNVSQRKTLDDSRMIWFDVCISYNYAMQDALSYEKVEVILLCKNLQNG